MNERLGESLLNNGDVIEGNSTRCPDVSLMLVQPLRRWPNFKLTSGERLMYVEVGVMICD